ncbi:TetR/AcrR family transcriptional regulator [Actinomadura macrotermitis]|uniref:Putative HTH-type transcriptional regulator YxaF n=1 Tax=Actinomadura macrotermitis TaxID=2585200 RepID=A0A7K0C7G6_9ACTN|nr:TetR/AcrR family transcriptional regulator [Actinomadura macrotermitis]MQY09358.1 putative HTH-type transcriptional regulator YxaF [Actinomadura macrotermitis]
MAPHGETRDRVLHTAADLFQRQGYHGTGLNQVLAESGAPKGSLYFHFPGGKEQLAADALRLSGAELAGELARAAAGVTGAREGITALGEHFARSLEESDYTKGCPLATVALETSSASAEIRGACDSAYGAWLDGIEGALRRWGVPAGEAGPLAVLVLSSLQGAIMLARVRRDASLIRTVARRLGDQAAALSPHQES